MTRDLEIPIPRYVTVRVVDSFDQPVEGASVYLYAASSGWQSGTTDEGGGFAFPSPVAPGAVSIDASTPEGLAGLAEGIVAGSDLALSMQLRSARLRLSLEDEAGVPIEGSVAVTALQQAWSWDSGGYEISQWVTTSAAGEVEVRVPFGFFRVEFDDGTALAGEDGELAEGETRAIRLRRGSHVRLSQPLAGDQGTYTNEPSQCPAGGCFPFVDVQADVAVPGVARSEILGQGLRSLRGASVDLRVEARRYVPPSGRFARTATVVTNMGPATETYVYSTLQVATDQAGATITATGSGDLDFGPDDAFVVVQPDSRPGLWRRAGRGRDSGLRLLLARLPAQSRRGPPHLRPGRGEDRLPRVLGLRRRDGGRSPRPGAGRPHRPRGPRRPHAGGAGGDRQLRRAGVGSGGGHGRPLRDASRLGRGRRARRRGPARRLRQGRRRRSVRDGPSARHGLPRGARSRDRTGRAAARSRWWPARPPTAA